MANNGPVVFVYQRMLPYHQARFAAVAEALRRHGQACVAMEVASFDRGYGMLSNASPPSGEAKDAVVCLFKGADYLDLSPKQVAAAVFDALHRLAPSIVFAPAPAFAEGAGALHYKVRHGGRLVLMDDAWDMTDQRGRLTRWVKRIFYGYVDGGFFPDRLHGDYFARLNIPRQRQRYAVNAVGPVPASSDAGVAGESDIGKPYLLFVGRLIGLKNVAVLLKALAGLNDKVIRLVVIGDGPESAALKDLAASLCLEARVVWLGRCSNLLARACMAKAEALLLPSNAETWGLVVNEAWLASTLVLGSETVGSLHAAYSPEMRWMMVPPGDVAGWRQALERLLALRPDERAVLVAETRRLAEKYSLAAHTQSALELINLPRRARPMAPAGWLARAWHGRVAVW
jgi:glycosyltransferase involved in cell wall biosynthesis